MEEGMHTKLDRPGSETTIMKQAQTEHVNELEQQATNRRKQHKSTLPQHKQDMQRQIKAPVPVLPHSPAAAWQNWQLHSCCHQAQT